MEEFSERFKRYLRILEEEKQNEIAEHSQLINTFIGHCGNIGISLHKDAIDYTRVIGLTANQPNIVYDLLPELQKDKEGLIPFADLTTLFKITPAKIGQFLAANFIAFAHPFFRRSFHREENYAPSFIQKFWCVNDKNINKAIALDPDRVGINLREGDWMELDTWYAPKFSTDIVIIKDDVGHLRTPADVDQGIVDLLFHKNYSLNIQWSTVHIDGEDAKVFQAEEFKTDQVTVEMNGTPFHPARYIHAIYKPSIDHFDHFDGAVHLYTNDEYLLRREQDFNYNSKNPVQIKAASDKLFKLTGLIPIATWMELTSHFFSQNPLIHEYFIGKYDPEIQDAIDAMRKEHS